ncbi:TetR family transcriptional regulator C-terminal domain-containing protein [Agromyces sp. NPDC058484]|uniref:TetR family transcriptional regulator C-terminal domain-containing protein n=1 Tax=Agromyces sp. NPDC058484 TaxID=3346524 RepID=UPI00364EE53A
MRTRARIVSAAADLFHRQGMNATSVNEILAASGTGKGQFYQHFRSLDELTMAVLSNHRDFVAAHAPITSWPELEAFLFEHVRAQESFAFTRGCPIGTAAYALQAEQQEYRLILEAALDVQRRKIAEFLEAEQDSGRLHPDASPRRLADFAIAVTQGGLLLSLVSRDGQAFHDAVSEALRHLRSLAIEWKETAR